RMYLAPGFLTVNTYSLEFSYGCTVSAAASKSLQADSSGSLLGGTMLWNALLTLTRPRAETTRRSVRTGSEVRMMRSLMSAYDIVELADIRRAAIPDTCGVAIEVPL